MGKYGKLHKMAFRLVLMFIMVSWGMQIHAGTVTGIVYQDSNRNNLPDENEPRLEGIVVSNGAIFAITDDAGEFLPD